MPELELDNALKIPFLVIGIVITVAIVVAMFPTLNDQLYQITVVQSNNTLIQAIRPVLPYLTGVVLLLFILVPVFFALKKIGLIQVLEMYVMRIGNSIYVMITKW